MIIDQDTYYDALTANGVLSGKISKLSRFQQAINTIVDVYLLHHKQQDGSELCANDVTLNDVTFISSSNFYALSDLQNGISNISSDFLTNNELSIANASKVRDYLLSTFYQTCRIVKVQYEYYNSCNLSTGELTELSTSSFYALSCDPIVSQTTYSRDIESKLRNDGMLENRIMKADSISALLSDIVDYNASKELCVNYGNVTYAAYTNGKRVRTSAINDTYTSYGQPYKDMQRVAIAQKMIKDDPNVYVNPHIYHNYAFEAGGLIFWNEIFIEYMERTYHISVHPTSYSFNILTSYLHPPTSEQSDNSQSTMTTPLAYSTPTTQNENRHSNKEQTSNEDFKVYVCQNERSLGCAGIVFEEDGTTLLNSQCICKDNESVVLSAIPLSYSRFSHWEFPDGITSSCNPLSIFPSCDISAIACFTPNPYFIGHAFSYACQTDEQMLSLQQSMPDFTEKMSQMSSCLSTFCISSESQMALFARAKLAYDGQGTALFDIRKGSNISSNAIEVKSATSTSWTVASAELSANELAYVNVYVNDGGVAEVWKYRIDEAQT